MFSLLLQILHEIQEVVIEKVSQRFDHVRNDVRLGRDGILRAGAANLEAMCTERWDASIFYAHTGLKYNLQARAISTS
jgi:hypothetical protein